MLTINEANITRAWNVQGDPQRLGVALPIAPNTVTRTGSITAMWLGPHSWLVFADRVDAQDGAVFDVSASRVGWTLEGTSAASVLAKHCALDLAKLAPGSCAQSLFGQVNALYYRHGGPSNTTSGTTGPGVPGSSPVHAVSAWGGPAAKVTSGGAGSARCRRVRSSPTRRRSS